MPTYENPTSSAKMVKNSVGGFEPLIPGETIETLYFSESTIPPSSCQRIRPVASTTDQRKIKIMRNKA
jgi:hypothetical protein